MVITLLTRGYAERPQLFAGERSRPLLLTAKRLGVVEQPLLSLRLQLFEGSLLSKDAWVRPELTLV